MQNWIKITLILCLFGTLRELRPSEPFVSEFLLGEWRNITEEQLNRDVYPIGTYSYVAQLVVIFLITDFLRFKPVIILSGLSGIAVYAILLWTKSLEWLQVTQVLYGMYMATEVAYLTYIYAQVDASKYSIVSSYTRIAGLVGRFLSGVSSQLLVHFGLMDYRDLNYITFTSQILATFWAFWLPPVQYGIYFHRRNSILSSAQLDNSSQKQPPQHSNKRTFRDDVVEASSLIGRHARAAYVRPTVLAWSALYAVALALFVQVQTYVQLLWRWINDETGTSVAYNGAVEAAQTLLGAGGAYVSSVYAHAAVPAATFSMQAVACFLAAYVRDVYVSYAGYILLGTLFHYNITMASAKIASQLCDESCFGLIFGINTLIGTALQSLLTLLLIQVGGLHITSQYFSLSGMYLLFAVAWFTAWIMHSCRQKRSLNAP